jgi:biliverdin reductase
LPAPLAIAVVGGGMAGRARVAALEEQPDARLAALVRRDGQPRFEDVLADPGVDAVIVCTPNALHAEQVRAALDAGKHVAVEFPLAANVAAARELFALARERGRVLHVEHIELLSAAQRTQRERAAALGRPTGGTLWFTGRSRGWLGDASLAGSEALRALARLHRLMDCFGPANAGRAALESRAAGWTLEVELEFEAGGTARLAETRAPELERALRWEIECERGRLADPPPSSARGVFKSDTDCFVARVREGAPSYVSEERVLRGLALVGQIEALL